MTLNKKFLFLLIAILFVLLVGFFALKNPEINNPNKGTATLNENAQIIEIDVKGGYSPSSIEAKSNTKTYLKFKTNNTYDCSSSIYISTLGVRDFLPATGEKIYEIPQNQAKGTIKGSCSMGHYQFAINFI